MKKEALLDDFKQSLIAAGKSKLTVKNTINIVRRFLRHAGDTHLDRLTEEVTRAFFDGYEGQTRRQYAMVISQFLRFAVRNLPAVINARGAESPRAPAPTRKELAIRQRWSVDKLIEQKQTADDLIAKLARKLIDHYLYFQGRMKGEPENLDDVYRFADECKELIESNLALFMKLSAQGRNIHSAIDERVQR